MSRKTVRLTKARHAYASARAEAPRFKGTPLRNNAAVEARYVEALQSLCAQMTSQVKREVVRLFKGGAATSYFPEGHAAMDAAGPNIGSQARILMASLNQRFNALFAKKARKLSTQMMDGATAASKTALHGSLKTLTGGLSLKTDLMTPPLKAIYNASVAANVSLIKSIPQTYLKDVEGAVMRSITSGAGLKDLVPAIEQYEGQTHRRAKNIALDQTRKAYNSINRGRMETVGVKRFEWIHSGGGAEPRPLHMEMDGQIYSFDDLPVIDENTGERGIPGQAVNCRCTMAPVFDFSDTEKDGE